MQQQAPINPATAAALTLMSEEGRGEFKPTTSEGTPTVAAQLMQKAMSPTLPQVAQQVGLGAQIQAMQQQQAQQAMMQQAMANRPPAGIEGLSPNIQGYADGGIVGYAEGDEVEDKSALRAFLDRLPEGAGLRKLADFLSKREQDVANWQRAQQLVDYSTPPAMAEIPIPEIQIAQPQAATPAAGAAPAGPALAPGAAPGAGAIPRGGITYALPAEAQRYFTAAEGAIKRSQERSVAPEDVGKEFSSMQEQRRKQLIALGQDPDFYKTAAAEAEKRGQERAAYYDALAEKLAGQQKSQGLIDFLLGAKGFRGQGLGAVLGSGAAAARAGEVATEEKTQRIMELKLQAQDAAVKDKQLLRKAQYETDMGDFDKARKTLEEREKNRQVYERAEAELNYRQGKEIADREMQMRGQNIQREVGLARTEGRDTAAQAGALRAAAASAVAELGKLPNRFTAENKAKAAQLEAQLETYRKQLLALTGVDELAAVAPSAGAPAGSRPPLSSFQR